YELFTWLEFRRVLFRSQLLAADERPDLRARAEREDEAGEHALRRVDLAREEAAQDRRHLAGAGEGRGHGTGSEDPLAPPRQPLQSGGAPGSGSAPRAEL